MLSVIRPDFEENQPFAETDCIFGLVGKV